MARVVLDQLVKTYPESAGPGVRAVNGIDLEIADGEFMVLVGPSGCGKSTTLRMIAGLEEVSEGTISIDGQAVNDVLPKDRDIAMVFQNYALYPHMTVYENMAFGLRLRKFSPAEIDARVREAAAMLGLEQYLDRKPKALSGGQRQRVAVGRAIVRKPKVFLFDEPLSNLDAKMRVSTRAEISRLHARLGVTMIYVTHDQVEAMTLGDRICVMRDGHIMQVATPLELYDRPANLFVAGFIGSPAMNLFPGEIRRVGAAWHFVGQSGTDSALNIPLDARLSALVATRESAAVCLGVRPEDVSTDESAHHQLFANVEVAEQMGSETYLHLSTGGTNFIARTPASVRFRRGDRIGVRYDLTKAHLFDASSEQRLS